MLTDDCINRLHNWKFAQARDLLTDDATASERSAVSALSSLLGNPGWFEGALGGVVGALVGNLGGDE